MDAAYRVCIRKSISTVELKDVIAETGMNHGAIYRYFKDLDEIIGAMVVQVIRELCQFLYRQMDGCGIDAVKISFYANVFVINKPERVAKIFESIKDCNTSSSVLLI